MTKRIYFSIALVLALFTSCEEQKNIVDLVAFDKVWNHLEQFDRIAQENDSNRAVGSPGGIASKEYIIETLKKSGLNTVTQDFVNHSGAKASNLIVDIKGKSANEVIMVGSHYDSVKFGPGINDNASGVAILLEIITALANNNIVPEKTIRFAFWDSEETGVEGSPAYYNSLSDSEKKEIKAYINIDMVASIGGEIQITDTEGKTAEAQLEKLTQEGVDSLTLESLKVFYDNMKFAEGSDKLEKLATDIFAQLGVTATKDSSFAMNSDTSPFFKDIPTIGILAIKVIERPSEDGGVILDFAPCYHQACDDINNIDKGLLEICLKASTMMIEKLALEKQN